MSNFINLFNDWDFSPVIQHIQDPVKSDYGWFHVYAFTMTMGIFLALAASAIKFHIRGIPTIELVVAAVPVIPFSLLGGSFIGKINKDGYEGFWSKFQFWEGGMSIHGGILFGVALGIPIFYLIGKYRTRVSALVYADCIIPNILLGQVIGRWGNFFNHELNGLPVVEVYPNASGHNPLSWLPRFIYENTQFEYTGSERTLNGVKLINGHIYQTEPIFLYESFGLFMLWLLITFVIPGFGRWISKKPWKLFSDVYSFDLKYTTKNLFTLNHSKQEGKMTYHEIWNDAFYLTQDQEAIENYEKYYREHILTKEKLSAKEKFLKFPSLIKNRWENGKQLVKANNPFKYSIIKCGVEGSCYFFGWNLVRFVLEQRREVSDKLINNAPLASNLIIGISMALGLVLIISCQFVFPYLIRKPNYQYEKLYFPLKKELLDSKS